MREKIKPKVKNAEQQNPATESLKSFRQEFGKVLDPVAFLNDKDPALCTAFLKLHELTLNDGAISKKIKFLMHAAITAALHDESATTMHILGAVKAGTSEKELLETAFTIIPVAGMPAFAVFLTSWKKVINTQQSQSNPNQ